MLLVGHQQPREAPGNSGCTSPDLEALFRRPEIDDQLLEIEIVDIGGGKTAAGSVGEKIHSDSALTARHPDEHDSAAGGGSQRRLGGKRSADSSNGRIDCIATLVEDVLTGPAGIW